MYSLEYMEVKMKVSRRKFIWTLGGGGIVVAASTVGLSRCDQMPAVAVAPWTNPSSGETDPRRWALAHALLAPNPHNIQPWIADLRVPEEITLWVDPNRLLPETDPNGRQILIGHGTFIELLDLAAREQGYRLNIDLFPNGEAPEDALAAEVPQYPAARIRFEEDASVQKDPLFQQVFTRRSIKEPYDMERPLKSGHERALRETRLPGGSSFELADQNPLADRLRDLTSQAVLTELETPRTLKESVDLTRVGASEIARHRDGIDLHGPMFWWLKHLGLFTPEDAMTPGTMSYQGGVDYALGWASGTRAFGWISTASNSRADQVLAGRDYVRLNLAATAAGVAMHPVSQLLQEYAEMTGLQSDFIEAVQPPEGSTVQMLFRLGYADRVPPSPRRGLDSLVRT
jgi:hypothetical protein